MKFLISFLPLILLTLNTPTPTSLQSFGGSWCPYQVESLVPCKVRNGSEFYMSSVPLCSKSAAGAARGQDGSLTCMQRVLRRPKFITTFKKVTETKYKCCPALTGSDCQTECFNCSSFQKLEAKVAALEIKRKVEAEEEVLYKGHRNPYRDTGGEETDDDLNSVTIEDLHNVISSPLLVRTIRRLLANVRKLDFRLAAVEQEMRRLASELTSKITTTATGTTTTTTMATTKKKKSSWMRSIAIGPEYQVLLKSPERNVEAEEEAEAQKMKDEDHLMTSFKILENNLARGDIASTLNDDYGEEERGTSGGTSGSAEDDEYQDELMP